MKNNWVFTVPGYRLVLVSDYLQIILLTGTKDDCEIYHWGTGTVLKIHFTIAAFILYQCRVIRQFQYKFKKVFFFLLQISNLGLWKNQTENEGVIWWKYSVINMQANELKKMVTVSYCDGYSDMPNEIMDTDKKNW